MSPDPLPRAGVAGLGPWPSPLRLSGEKAAQDLEGGCGHARARACPFRRPCAERLSVAGFLVKRRRKAPLGAFLGSGTLLGRGRGRAVSERPSARREAGGRKPSRACARARNRRPDALRRARSGGPALPEAPGASEARALSNLSVFCARGRARSCAREHKKDDTLARPSAQESSHPGPRAGLEPRASSAAHRRAAERGDTAGKRPDAASRPGVPGCTGWCIYPGTPREAYTGVYTTPGTPRKAYTGCTPPWVHHPGRHIPGCTPPREAGRHIQGVPLRGLGHEPRPAPESGCSGSGPMAQPLAPLR